jgi:spore maturation protein CgeB
VVPLKIARGIQNKVLEGLAARRPVISSPQALEGLDLTAGQHIYSATAASEWASSINVLMDDTDECRRLAEAGYAYVRERHRWEQCLAPLAEMLQLDAPMPAFASGAQRQRVANQRSRA